MARPFSMEAGMAEKTVKCVVLRDYWPTEDNRVKAGSIVDVSPEDAMDGVEAGRLSRVKEAK